MDIDLLEFHEDHDYKKNAMSVLSMYKKKASQIFDQRALPGESPVMAMVNGENPELSLRQYTRNFGYKKHMES